MAAPRLRRTRFVCVADTHNCTVKLPPGDVLIHAGDLSNQGSYSELSKAVRWLEAADFEAKIVVAGNHDITLDAGFYAEHGLGFHNQKPESHAACLSLLTSSPSIIYLCHASATVRLASPAGPHTTFAVFGSPYSPRHGPWAFAYDAAQASSLWDQIPLDADVVVTHTPPRGHCDGTDERRPPGCEALRRALGRVRPRLAVCGHIHDGRGAERVSWHVDGRDVEDHVVGWTDRGAGDGNNRLSRVDLTGKHSPPLANDGSVAAAVGPASKKSPSDDGGGGTTGLGGDSGQHGALAGSMGRRETCVVNAAMMKSRYPHAGGRQFYKPIVVDVDLPVWEEE